MTVRWLLTVLMCLGVLVGCGKKKEAERQAEAPEIPDGGISAITTPEAQRENSAPLKVDIKKPLTGEESAKVIEAV
ncbi:uncharacterized protein METZ01_LOCUS322033, partial [marine metagenome]